MTAVLDALALVVEQDLDADNVLREAVRVLADAPGVSWAAIRFLENGELVTGPSAGAEDDRLRSATAIVFQGGRVGELVVDGSLEHATLERVADVLSPYVLLGWDTGGEAWSP